MGFEPRTRCYFTLWGVLLFGIQLAVVHCIGIWFYYHFNLISKTDEFEQHSWLVLPSVQKQAAPLPPDLRNQSVLFVHVGKAGGSALRQLLLKSNRACTKAHPDDAIFACALNRVTSRITHMWGNQDKYLNYSQFIVTVRDPIDRLISWYNYERHLYRTSAGPGICSNPKLTLLQKCFANSNALFNFNVTFSNASTHDDNFTTANETAVPPVIKAMDGLSQERIERVCIENAQSCLNGTIPCYAHNFYNYEVYLEDLITWKQRNKNIVRVDVIRSEHSRSDLQTILELWTGLSMNKVDQDEWLGSRVNSASDHAREELDHDSSSIRDSTFVSPTGIQQICRLICAELIAYQSIISFADNLNTSQIIETNHALDEHCGFSVRIVCGSHFEYRAIKEQKEIAKGSSQWHNATFAATAM